MTLGTDFATKTDLRMMIKIGEIANKRRTIGSVGSTNNVVLCFERNRCDSKDECVASESDTKKFA